ncbi:MAG: DUF4303 domain-containing protein [Marinifilaceae bacterium]|jgi:hypothetical protein|nr:DUF4303 domain-containing protein [Marinifilaceae bacterium]
MELKQYIKSKIAKGILTSLEEEKEEIYAFSLYVNDEDDDLRTPTILLGFNTEKHFESEIDHASDENEARWNYAFWLQNEVLSIGEYNGEQEDRIKITEWIKAQELYYTDEQEDEDFDACLDLGAEITVNFVELLIEIVQDLQEDLDLEQPILIHELEYYPQIAEQNIRANGLKKVKEFTNWIAS